jgi:hypothetical protein
MRSQVKIAQKGIDARKRKRLMWTSILWISSVLVAFFGLAWLSHAGFMSMKAVEVEGAARISPDEVRAVADGAMAGNHLGLFSRRNALLYPQDAIRDAVAAFPAALSVEVGRKRFNIVEISVVERKEEARWCSDGSGDEALGGLDVGCFSVDEDGLIFDRSAASTVVAYRGAPMGNPIGKPVLPREDFRRTQFFVRQIGGMSLDPREVRFKEAGYIDVLLGQGGVLVVNASDDLSAVLANLSAVLAGRSSPATLGAFLSSFEYIRLDSGNKVFIKPKP